MRCDSHIHIVGGPEGLLPTRTYTPEAASVSALQAVATPLGISRFVVVQPSFYGTDNAVLLAALAGLAGHGRGVAVIDPSAPGDLPAMHQAGVRGLRINLYSTLSAAGPRDLERLFADTAAVAARMGWHVEVLAALPLLARHAMLLAGSPVPVVIDHYGLHAGHAPDAPEGQSLLELLRHEHVWIKLSAPYRVEADPLALRPNLAWMRALLATAERCVWGSDWPHTPPHEQQAGGGVPLPYRRLDYAAVVQGFVDAVGDTALAERIMTTNAARLYGF